MSNDLPHEPGSQQASYSQPRGLSTVPYSADRGLPSAVRTAGVCKPSGIAIAGLAAIALVVSASAAPHAAAASGSRPGRHASAVGQGQGAPPSGTRAESLRLARKLVSKAVLPPGTRAYHGKRLPPGLRNPASTLGSQTRVDAHLVYSEKDSLKQAIAFLKHHHPAGWRQDGTGETSRGGAHGKEVLVEKDVSYWLGKLGPQYSAIEMDVVVVPGHHGHAFLRTDVQVVWFPPRSATEHLVASDFKSVTIHEEQLGKKVQHARRTFKQQAIIGKLTRVLSHEHASPGGFVSCPAEFVTYELVFTPKKGNPKAVINASGCFQYGITVGAHPQPALVDDGKVESIAKHLMRKHGHQVHPDGTPKLP